MAVNQNGFNSRVTSEALEERFRQVFPAQAGAELIQDLYASGVIVPTIDFTSVAEGSFLPQNLQTAWDFATNLVQITTPGPTTLISTPGFWQIDLIHAGVGSEPGAIRVDAYLDIFDGSSAKKVWQQTNRITGAITQVTVLEDKFIVFLRSGDILRASVPTNLTMNVWYRQVASVNGVLVNPLGFTF